MQPATPSEVQRAIKELCAKHRAAGAEASSIVVRGAAMEGVNPSATADELLPDVSIVDASTTCVIGMAQPRVNALRRAASPGEFDIFVQDIIEIAVPLEARRIIVLNRKATTLSAVESWLRNIGDDMAPAVLGELTPASQSSGQLISMCLAAQDSCAAWTVDRTPQPSLLGRHITFRTDSGGGDLSSEVLRERSTVQSDLHDVEADKQMKGSVQTLTDMAKDESHAQPGCRECHKN